MTLTAAQAEIVRRFVAGDDDLIREYWKRERELDDILRAALREKDAEIERLKAEAAQHEEEPYEGEYWRPGTDNYGSLE